MLVCSHLIQHTHLTTDCPVAPGRKSFMLKNFMRMPIFHRLFLAFFLAVLIPDLIILTMSIIYTKALIAHGMAASQTGPFIIGTILALVLPTGVVVSLG